MDKDHEFKMSMYSRLSRHDDELKELRREIDFIKLTKLGKLDSQRAANKFGDISESQTFYPAGMNESDKARAILNAKFELLNAPETELPEGLIIKEAPVTKKTQAVKK